LGIDKDEEEYADNKESKTEEVEKLSDSPEEVKKATDFVLGQGIPPVEDFPFLNRLIKLEKDVQQLRAAFVAIKKIETDVHKAQGGREKAL
jgi:GTP1/Obg family GTP-binding protein